MLLYVRDWIYVHLETLWDTAAVARIFLQDIQAISIRKHGILIYQGHEFTCIDFNCIFRGELNFEDI